MRVIVSLATCALVGGFIGEMIGRYYHFTTRQFWIIIVPVCLTTGVIITEAIRRLWRVSQ